MTAREAPLRDDRKTVDNSTTGQSPAALDVNGNRVFRVSQITVSNGGRLVLGPDDQAFFVGTKSDGQYPSRHTFVVLERIDPDAG